MKASPVSQTTWKQSLSTKWENTRQRARDLKEIPAGIWEEVRHFGDDRVAVAGLAMFAAAVVGIAGWGNVLNEHMHGSPELRPIFERASIPDADRNIIRAAIEAKDCAKLTEVLRPVCSEGLSVLSK